MRGSYFLYLFSLFFAPVAFGSVENWTQLIVEFSCFLSLLLLLLAAWRKDIPLYNTPGLPLFLTFLGVCLLQLIPLPFWVVEFLSPNTAILYQPIDGHGSTPGFIPLTLAPYLSVQAFFRYAAWGAMYFLTIQLLRDRQRMLQALSVVIASGALLAFCAILQEYAGNGKIWWFMEPPSPTGFFGTFFYKNHFGGYIALLLPVALMLSAYCRPCKESGQSLRQRFADIFNNKKHHQFIYWGLAGLLMAVALLISRSRGGIICASITCLAMLAFGRKRMNRAGFFLPLLFALLVVIGLGASGFNSVDTRFGQALTEDGVSLGGRVGFWQDSLPMVKDFPVFGTGAGAFSQVFPMYGTVAANRFLNSAHNDHLENITDFGLPGAAVIVFFLFVVVKSSYGMYKRRRDRLSIHLALGCMTGITALLLHSFVDYQFRISAAVGLYFFFLLGLAVASSHLRSRGNRPTLLRPVEQSNVLKCMSVGVTGLLLVAGTTVIGGQTAGIVMGPSVESLHLLEPGEKCEMLLSQTVKAQKFDPLNSNHYFVQALLYSTQNDYENAKKSISHAIRLSPAIPVYYQLYADYLIKLGELPLAEQAYDAAILRDPYGFDKYWAKGLYYLNSNRKEDGLRLIRHSFELRPGVTRRFLNILTDKGVSLLDLEAVLPDSVQAYLAYAGLCHRENKIIQADLMYQKALAFLEKGDKVKSSWLWQPYQFYAKQKKMVKAMGVARIAVQYLPDDFRFNLTLGDLYLREGMARKATEQYKIALAIKPEDETARIRLEQLL